MTIRKGTVYEVESFAEFREALDVSWGEVAEALDETHQEEMLSAVNEGRSARGDPEAEDVSALDWSEIAEWIDSASFTDTRLLQPVLEARDQEYTHVIDGRSHRIIELDEDDRPTVEDMAVAIELLTLLLSERVPEVEGNGQRFSVPEVGLVYDAALEMDCGANVTGVSVTQTSVILTGHIKMERGKRPYADGPTEHETLLEHPTLARTEGSVVYEQDGEVVSLPKHLYFEEEREFDVHAETPGELAAAVANALGFDVAFEWVVNSLSRDVSNKSRIPGDRSSGADLSSSEGTRGP